MCIRDRVSTQSTGVICTTEMSDVAADAAIDAIEPILASNPVLLLCRIAYNALLDLFVTSTMSGWFNWISCTMAILLLERVIRSILVKQIEKASRTATLVDDIAMGICSLIFPPGHYHMNLQSMVSVALAALISTVADQSIMNAAAEPTRDFLFLLLKGTLGFRVVLSLSSRMDAALLILAESLAVHGFQDRGLVYFSKFARFVLWGVTACLLYTSPSPRDS
eukprot:TRINITY_DN61624_c0_g1_i2.p1 TRINITY_DN61624_c0_g1~~TRINITY_DN61624_c0_g1_i2.p1  ORF type:complete len:222 (-),score=70.73 TRINITY_DN61624_c0_g1_i2:97-762(-)